MTNSSRRHWIVYVLLAIAGAAGGRVAASAPYDECAYEECFLWTGCRPASQPVSCDLLEGGGCVTDACPLFPN